MKSWIGCLVTVKTKSFGIFLRKTLGLDLRKDVSTFLIKEVGIILDFSELPKNQLFIITSSGKTGWVYTHEIERIT